MHPRRFILAKLELVAWCLFALLASQLAQPALALPAYNIVPIGLDDLEHTYNGGSTFNGVQDLNEAGHIMGYANRHFGGSAALGRSAWLYNGSTTLNIGLITSEHTRNDGYKSSFPEEMNDLGQVLGYSDRYKGGSTELGQSAWLYDGANTVNIGLTGPEHTRSDGYRRSTAEELNEAGQVSGTSNRYSGGEIELGQSAWLYDGATTINIGFTGQEHTRDDGYKFSNSYDLNEEGHVLGVSRRYGVEGTDLGQSAWVYDGASTINIGLIGGKYTGSDGYQFSQSFRLNEAGQVSGISWRAGGGSNNWFFDGVNTIEIGLVGAEHTPPDGHRAGGATRLNEAGQVTGTSERFGSGGQRLGRSGWFYNGTTTVEIGLTGPENTRDDGYRDITLKHLNQSGDVMGFSELFNGKSSPWGRSVWLFNGTTTINVGLTDIEHTGNLGQQESHSQQLNEAGHVAGYSLRYGSGRGVSAWLYNGTTTLNIGLTGAEHTRSSGARSSEVWELNNAGHVTGYSERFDGGSIGLGRSAWLYDGTTTIEIGLTGSDYTSIHGGMSSEPTRINGVGQVIGYSRRYNGGDVSLGESAWFYDSVLDQTFELKRPCRTTPSKQA
ncbi:MAG: hypothetical protein WD851_06325 [Pirellulales bacterium]